MTFDLRIRLGRDATGSAVLDIIDGSEAAVARGLGVQPHAVEVSLADDLRRLASAPDSLELNLLVKIEVQSGIRSAIEKVKELTGDANALLQLLKEELMVRGLDVSGLQVEAGNVKMTPNSIEAGNVKMTPNSKPTSLDNVQADSNISRMEPETSATPPHASREQKAGGNTMIGVAVGTALGAALFCGLAIAYLRRSKKIAPHPPSPSARQSNVVVWGVPDEADKISIESGNISTRSPSNSSLPPFPTPHSSAPSFAHQATLGSLNGSWERPTPSERSASIEEVSEVASIEDAFAQPPSEFGLGEPPSFTFSLRDGALADFEEPQILPPIPPPGNKASTHSGTSSSGSHCCTASSSRVGGRRSHPGSKDPPSPKLLSQQTKDSPSSSFERKKESSRQPMRRLAAQSDQQPPLLLPPVLPGGPPVVQRRPGASGSDVEKAKQNQFAPSERAGQRQTGPAPVRCEASSERCLQTSSPGRGMVSDEPLAAQPPQPVRQRQQKPPARPPRNQRIVEE